MRNEARAPEIHLTRLPSVRRSKHSLRKARTGADRPEELQAYGDGNDRAER
jgi:hypothetical protein